MSNPVIVSVAILAYNHEKYVAEAIESILSQRSSYSFEIVIGEDASKDRTRDIIIGFQQKFPDTIKLLPAAANKGVMLNYRDTLRECSGKYIALCSADDYWHDPEKLEKQISFLEKNPDYTFIHTDSDFYFQQREDRVKNSNLRYQSQIPEGNIFDQLLVNKFYIITATTCFLRSHFEKYVSVDQFIQEGFTYEDIATWLELARHGKFKYLPDSTATYRLLPDSIAHSHDLGKKFNFLKMHYRIKMYYIKKYDVSASLREEFEISYHRKKFDLAYNWLSNEEALDSFRFLSKRGLADNRMKFKRLAVKFPFLKQATRAVKKFFNPDASYLEFS